MPDSMSGTTTTTTSSNAIVSKSEPQLELEWPELELDFMPESMPKWEFDFMLD